MDVSRNFGVRGKPVVIRKVIRMHKTDGRPKRARDRKAGIDMERIKARTAKPCAYHDCPHPQGLIMHGTEYARVDKGDRKRMGKHMVPITKDYHFECVPPEARPLVRFFR